ncbi:MAG: ATP:corrinoid adenosyltransferase BtuR/CobO/CobP [Candidatus Argoarchaeum ethanivorans]|uniref:ATP:corrinoid adenosyltransferase BtuR/CobO/CobP n=1 Tax=Candidatus Argoarchaeum ethanivorans TaxID=2608793 RepID=A0A811TF19_9EURY|nr:MAG: ATP:corrinoid adenosyltransferase BtuR/CobO/CobP [Candidatus Argoarchaeum ethanivorans]
MNRMHMVMNSAAEGKIIVYYGKGEGKTSASIGHAIRMLGHNKKVVILQFMKGRQTTGEYQFLKHVDNIQMYLCGPPVFLDRESRKAHLKNAKEGLKIANRVLDEKQTDLLVLDEILYAVKFGLLTEDDVLELLEKRGCTAIILSGRDPGDRIIEMADIVTHTEQIKYHWDKNSNATTMMGY